MTKRIILFFSVLCTFCAHAQELKLWYANPANVWVEALPLGNGRLGCMTFGGTATEELQLNEETFWAGGPHRNDSPTALENLPKVENLSLQVKIERLRILSTRLF